MRRVWDCIGFAVLFVGLGYVVLRLLPGNVLLPPALHVSVRFALYRFRCGCYSA